MNGINTADGTGPSWSNALESSLQHPSILQDRLDKAGITIETYEILSWFLMRKNLRVSAHAFFFATDLKWAIGAPSLRHCAREIGVSHECLRKEVKEWEGFLYHRRSVKPKPFHRIMTGHDGRDGLDGHDGTTLSEDRRRPSVQAIMDRDGA